MFLAYEYLLYLFVFSLYFPYFVVLKMLAFPHLRIYKDLGRCRLTNVNTFRHLCARPRLTKQTFPPIFWSRNGCTAAQRRFLSASMGVTSHVFSDIFSDQKRLEKNEGCRGLGMPWNRLAANCYSWFCFQLMHLKKLAKSFLACICGMSVPVVSLGPQVWMQQSVPVPRVDTGCKPFIRCNACLVCNSYQTKSAS